MVSIFPIEQGSNKIFVLTREEKVYKKTLLWYLLKLLLLSVSCDGSDKLYRDGISY